MKPPRGRHPTHTEALALLADQDLRQALRAELVGHSVYLDAEQLRALVRLAEHLAQTPSGLGGLDMHWILLEGSGNGRTEEHETSENQGPNAFQHP